MMCKGIDEELLTRVVCDSRLNIVLISRALVSTTECTTLTYTSGSCCVLVCVVSSNSVLLVPSHTNISRVAGIGTVGERVIPFRMMYILVRVMHVRGRSIHCSAWGGDSV